MQIRRQVDSSPRRVAFQPNNCSFEFFIVGWVGLGWAGLGWVGWLLGWLVGWALLRQPSFVQIHPKRGLAIAACWGELRVTTSPTTQHRKIKRQTKYQHHSNNGTKKGPDIATCRVELRFATSSTKPHIISKHSSKNRFKKEPDIAACKDELRFATSSMK